MAKQCDQHQHRARRECVNSSVMIFSVTRGFCAPYDGGRSDRDSDDPGQDVQEVVADETPIDVAARPGELEALCAGLALRCAAAPAAPTSGP